MGSLFPLLSMQASDRNVLALGDRGYSRIELARLVGGYRSRLRERGLRPGDRVAVRAEPRVEAMIAFIGNALEGWVSVPLNPKLGIKERTHILADAAPSLIVGAPEAWGVASESWSMDVGEAMPFDRTLDDQPMFILYTSGTTGAPKGAVLSSSNVAHNLDALAEVWRWRAEDTVVHALPLFHVHGLILGLLGSLRAGGAFRYVTPFSPEAIADAITAVTNDAGQAMLFAVPTMYARLADAARANKSIGVALSEARLLISGSAGLPKREHDRIKALTGRGVHERYGLTETLINCAVSGDGPPLPGYVGRPLPGVELKIVNGSRTPLEDFDDKTIGEIAVRGPSVFAGYLDRPDATSEVFDDDGWFYTGDLATRRADGAIRIVGRKATDLIKTGGYRVGAGEVEGCLLEHPSVSEVAVIGVPDEDLGERLEAFVVFRNGVDIPCAQELIDLVATELTPHKRPRVIHHVEALPRNAMGKVQKTRLLRR